MTCKASLILRHIEGIACHTRNVKTKYVPYLQKACTYVEFLHTRNAYPIAGHLDPSVLHSISRFFILHSVANKYQEGDYDSTVVPNGCWDQKMDCSIIARSHDEPSMVSS
jgi:hypothetical protein